MQGKVLSVALSPVHGFHKDVRQSIRLIEGLGVEGDAHAGAKVQHLYRQRLDPEAPNLAQVHFLHRELFDEMAARGFTLTPGLLGENVLTEGLDLITLPTGTIFRIGPEAVVEISGCRSPCHQIDDGIKKGLTNALIGRDAEGQKLRKAGIMGVVRVGGVVAPGDTIEVELPEKPWRKLEVV
jgi:MOSC domain-containing protein YiiM